MDMKPKVPDKYTYGEMEELLFAFEALLRKQSQTIPAGLFRFNRNDTFAGVG